MASVTLDDSDTFSENEGDDYSASDSEEETTSHITEDEVLTLETDGLEEDQYVFEDGSDEEF